MTSHPRAYTVDAFCEAYAVKRSLAYELIRTGELIARKVTAKKTVILAEDAERWASGLPSLHGAAVPVAA